MAKIKPPQLAITDTATTNEDTPIVINVLGNDLDPNSLGKSLFSLNQNGTTVVTKATSKLGATITINADGTVQYGPAARASIQALAQGEVLLDTFVYTMKEGNTLSTATVSVTLTGVNDAPVVAGTVLGQATTDAVTMRPFSKVTVTDVDHAALDSAIITLTNSSGIATDANGVLSGTGLLKTGTGTYAMSPGIGTGSNSTIDVVGNNLTAISPSIHWV